MALKTSLTDSNSAKYLAVDFHKYYTALLSEGVLNESGAGTDYKIIENTPAGMSVVVKTGVCLVSYSKGGNTWKVFTENNENLVLTISPNSSGAVRMDAIVIHIKQDESNALRNNVAECLVVVGNSPIILTDSAIDLAFGDTDWYRLANVSVANGATSILNTNITDTRKQVRTLTASTSETGDVSIATANDIETHTHIDTETGAELIVSVASTVKGTTTSADENKIPVLEDGKLNTSALPPEYFQFGGDGSDGALSVTSGTTILNTGQIYNFSSINIAFGAILSFSGDGVAILNCSGDFFMEGNINTTLETSILVDRRSLKFESIKGGSPHSLTFNSGGTGGTNGVSGTGGTGGTSTASIGVMGAGGAGGIAPYGIGSDGGGGYAIQGGGGGGGGAGQFNGYYGTSTSNINGGAGGQGGAANSTQTTGGNGGGGGGGLDTGSGGAGGDGAGGYGPGGNGGKGGNSGANGGIGGSGGQGGASGLYGSPGSGGKGGNGGDGGDGYVNGGSGGSGGSAVPGVGFSGGDGGNGGNAKTGIGGNGGMGGMRNIGSGPGGSDGASGNGGNGFNGGHGAPTSPPVPGGYSGNPGHGGNGGGATALLIQIFGNAEFGASSHVYAYGGLGGNGGYSAGRGAGGNGGNGADVYIVYAGTLTDNGLVINNSGGVGGSGTPNGTTGADGYTLFTDLKLI